MGTNLFFIMYFKRSVSFRLLSDKRIKGDAKILIRASWCGNRVELTTPHNIQREMWDQAKQKTKGKENSTGIPTRVINSDLDTLRGYANEVFNRYEFVEGRPPSVDEFKTLYNDLSGRQPISLVADAYFTTLKDAYARFLADNDRSWEIGTYNKYKTIRSHLTAFFGSLPLNDVTEQSLKQFEAYLSDKVGLRNSTLTRMMNRLKTFLRWAEGEGIYTTKAHHKYSPKLKGANVKEVIALTPEELQVLADATFVEGERYLERVRDILLFGCYTGLRYSDIQQLTKANIVKGKIRVVTIKTSDPIVIEINDVAGAIIEKYNDFDSVRLLPTISNQKANKYLKELGKRLGIDTPTQSVYYNSEGRQVEIKPKYELMTTHIARRTFISNALALGIPASVVMSWSGHKDFKAMKPYIKMFDQQKELAMSKFDSIIDQPNI